MFHAPQDQFDSHRLDIATGATATRAEILGAFSYALDLTEGQPAGHSLRAAWIGTYVGMAAGLSGQALNDCTYAIMLKDLGCSSNAARVAELFVGDDRKLKQQFKLIGPESAEFLAFVERNVGADSDEDERTKARDRFMADAGNILTGFIDTRCTQGADIARRLRFSDMVADAIANLDEHWDGSGLPRGKSGDAIPLLSRIALLAQVADVFFMTLGAEAAMAEVRSRSGSWLDPQLVDILCALGQDPAFWSDVGSHDIEQRLFALEPTELRLVADDDYLDDITTAFGQVIDAKSPFTGGHSERVGTYTDALATRLGIAEGPRRRLRRAAMLHDVGKLGVSSRILEKPGKLDSDEWQSMQSHASHTTAILGRVAVLRDLAMIAGSHHERLDGTGYPLGLDARTIALETRIISTADFFDALTADRPYRAAMSVDQALDIMAGEVGSAIDSDCFDALTSVLAHGIPAAPLPRIAL